MIPPASRTAFLALAFFGVAANLPGEEPAPPPAAPAEIKPLPPTPIPDDPPPHQGAMIDLPYVIEPPDVLVVEVLEALPGRPITGERLVRPDGTISLGFYGDVHVRGLTPTQAKAKIIAALGKHLTGEALGLAEPGKEPVAKARAVAPEESAKVSVDVASFNSKVYYVDGEVGSRSRLPWTGGETILDAIHFADGLLATADPDGMVLYRPARGDAPARKYPIRYFAILEGDAEQNLQVFPGDRIVVGKRKDMGPAPEPEDGGR